MKRLFILFVLIFLFKEGSAQNTTFYLDKNDQIIDSTKAVSFLIIANKAETDTIYQMRQFSLEKLLIVSGSFKDAALSVPHGTYYYYKIIRETPKGWVKGTDTIYRKPISRHLEKTGLFLNGKMEGTWKAYYADGTLQQIENFKHDVLDGPYESFNPNGTSLIKGNYINGKREGMWMEREGLEEITYVNDVVTKRKKNKQMQEELDTKMKERSKYDVSAKPKGDFRNELKRFMVIANPNGIGLENAKISLMVNEKGEISEPQISGLSDFTLMAKIKEFFLKSKWYPGTSGKDKIPVRTLVSYTLAY
jgi:antitoxin component YwqK of YwqJK toxin-antitoxin module